MTEAKTQKENSAIAGRIDELVMWNTGDPPAGITLLIKCDNCMGDYTIKAKRVDYKKPMPGQSKKGFKKGWRWVKRNGDTVSRKEAPSAWAHT